MEQNEEITTRELLEQSDELVRASRRLLADIDEVLDKNADGRSPTGPTGIDRDRRDDRWHWSRRRRPPSR